MPCWSKKDNPPPKKISVQGKILWLRRAAHQSRRHAGECLLPRAPRNGTGEANQVIFTPRFFLDGTPPKIGGLGRFVSFSKGSFSASNLFGHSWVYNLGDDKQIPVCCIIAFGEFF